jgi:hypothetical protein
LPVPDSTIVLVNDVALLSIFCKSSTANVICCDIDSDKSNSLFSIKIAENTIPLMLNP